MIEIWYRKLSFHLKTTFHKNSWIYKRNLCILIDIFISNQACKTFNEEGLWIKKTDNEDIDRPIYWSSLVLKLANCRSEWIVEQFKQCELSIAVEIYLKTTDLLDVFFDLTGGTFQPYRKRRNSPTYIHLNSKHPPSLIK